MALAIISGLPEEANVGQVPRTSRVASFEVVDIHPSSRHRSPDYSSSKIIARTLQDGLPPKNEEALPERFSTCTSCTRTRETHLLDAGSPKCISGLILRCEQFVQFESKHSSIWTASSRPFSLDCDHFPLQRLGTRHTAHTASPPPHHHTPSSKIAHDERALVFDEGSQSTPGSVPCCRAVCLGSISDCTASTVFKTRLSEN